MTDNTTLPVYPVLLAIDMDGVIADWYEAFSREFVKSSNHPLVDPLDLKHFYIENSYPPELTPLIREITLAPGFYSNMKPVEGAIEALKSMEKDVHIEPFLCTAPELDFTNQLCWSEKALWVEQHLGDYWLKRLMIVKDKSLAMADYLIDDKHVMKGQGIYETDHGTFSTSGWQRIVYDRAYNKDAKGRRMTWKDWPEIRNSIVYEGYDE